MKPIILLLIVCASAAAHELEFPPGWRMPTPSELIDKDYDHYRAIHPNKYATVKADFNGDGIEDHAFLLKSTEFSGEGLWVNLSMPTNDFSWINLRAINWGPESPNESLSMGIDIVPSGTQTYDCFEDDTMCNHGKERPQLELVNPGLAYFRFESASSFYFWSTDEGRFRRVWTSD